MRNIIILFITSLWMIGCASTSSSPSSSNAASTKLEPVKPSYSEKSTAIGVQAIKPSVSCPSEAKWESSDWRKSVSFANACVKSKDWGKVERIGEYLAKSAHLTPWGPYFLSLAAHSRKDYPRAVWMLELAIKKAPEEGLFHYQMGRLAWDQGDEVSALKEMKLASDLNPSLVDAHYVVGYLAMQKGDLSEGEKRLKKALAVDPRHLPTVMAIATLRMKSNDWEKSESALEEAIQLNPRSAKARLALAQVREIQLKKTEAALQSYKELRTLAGQKKLDESLNINLDEKILSLEKSIVQVKQEKQVSSRKPSQEGQVAK